jgi:hypothetical protein
MTESRVLIGWKEWVALPDLGLASVKAKVDTGARTSSLHAFDVKAYKERGQLKVKFKVHPVQRRSDVIQTCTATVVDHRLVSDSGGHREKRYVIVTTLVIGSLKFPIEMTLANRETMSYRMLIGRSAMHQLLIDPFHSYLLGKPERAVKSYKKSGKRGAKKSAAPE